MAKPDNVSTAGAADLCPRPTSAWHSRTPRGRRLPWLILFAGASGGVVAAFGSSPTEAVLSAVRGYLETYERQLVTIVGIEDYAQSLDGAATSRRRHLRSELGWVHLPAAGETIGLREVQQSDGIRAPDGGGRLRRLLTAPADARRREDDIRALLEESARYNLGAGSRNFNFPTFPLIYLHEVNRDRCSWKVRSVDATRARIEFKEKARPTIVRTPGSSTVPARGTCLVQSASGCIESCTVTLATRGRDSPTRYEMRVTFAHDPKLDVWLPSAMHDDYLQEGTVHAGQTHIVGDARYSGYRRFETGGRLVQ